MRLSLAGAFYRRSLSMGLAGTAICVLGMCTLNPSDRMEMSFLNWTPAQTADTAARVPAPAIQDSTPANGPPALVWNDGKQRFRAVHYIMKWTASSETWTPVSPDLTSAHVQGSEGYGVDGITAVAEQNGWWYVGTLVGEVSVKTPTGAWHAVNYPLPDRTVTAAAINPVNPSSEAAIAFGGFSSATPSFPGHVFTTQDGGNTWVDVTGNLPDQPIQSVRYWNDGPQTVLCAKSADTWYEFELPMHWVPVNPNGAFLLR